MPEVLTILLERGATFPLPMGPNREPPEAFRILKLGDNQATKGVFFLDAEGAKEAVDRFLAQGEDLPFDFHHWSEQVDDENPATKTAEATKAAGWFGLEAREDGLYAVKPPRLQEDGLKGVYFTPYALQGLKSLEWRHFSPAVLYRRMEDGRLKVVGISSIALTHKPSLVNQQPLLASQSGALNPAPKRVERKSMEEKDLLARAEKAEKALLEAQGLADYVALLCGTRNLSEARGRLQALKEQADRAEALSREVTQIKRDRIEGEAKSLLSAAKAEKKITPAEEPELLKAVIGDGKVEAGKEQEALARAEGQLSWLKGYLSIKAPVIATAPTLPLPGGGQKPVTEAPRNQVSAAGTGLTVNIDGKDLTYAQLSNMQRQKLADEDPTLYQAMLAEHQAQKDKNTRKVIVKGQVKS